MGSNPPSNLASTVTPLPFLLRVEVLCQPWTRGAGLQLGGGPQGGSSPQHPRLASPRGDAGDSPPPRPLYAPAGCICQPDADADVGFASCSSPAPHRHLLGVPRHGRSGSERLGSGESAAPGERPEGERSAGPGALLILLGFWGTSCPSSSWDPRLLGVGRDLRECLQLRVLTFVCPHKAQPRGEETPCSVGTLPSLQEI